jgi:predicted nucleic-acid-binding Zn-ribbon protein
MSLQPTNRLVKTTFKVIQCPNTRSQFSRSVLIPLALYVYVAVCQGNKFIVFINVQHLQFCEQSTQRCVFKVFYPKFSVHKVILSANLVYIFSVYLSM